MPFKILKDAGVVPREVEMFRERAALARGSRTAPTTRSAANSRRSWAELEQSIALRLEALRINPSL
jgi:hypothetical protein